jgi:hypothetical protein
MASSRENVAGSTASSLHEHETALSLTAFLENGTLQEAIIPRVNPHLRTGQRLVVISIRGVHNLKLL